MVVFCFLFCFLSLFLFIFGLCCYSCFFFFFLVWPSLFLILLFCINWPHCIWSIISLICLFSLSCNIIYFFISFSFQWWWVIIIWMKLCVVKERAERLYSFLNGVAKIRLCKCWQLIYVQLLGNQKCNCSCVLHFKYKIKTLSFQNFVFQENNCLCESFCVLASFYQQQSPRAILSHH